MKIDKPAETSPLAPVQGDRASGTRPERAASTPPQAPAADSVSLSERSRDLQRLSAASEPSFDAAKVEAVKSAIANGSFKVDPAKVADGLIASVAEILSHKVN